MAVLTLRQVAPKGKETVDTYALEVLLSEMGGRGVELTKDDGTTYHVLLNGPAASTCDCKGFTSHGHCKHCESLRALEAQGEL